MIFYHQCSSYRNKALAAGLAGVLVPGQPQPLDRAEHVERVPEVLFGDALVHVAHHNLAAVSSGYGVV